MVFSRKKLTLGSLVFAMLVGGATILAIQRPFRQIALPSGTKVDLLSINRDGGIANMLRDSALQGHEAIVVSYYSRTKDLGSPAESEDIAELLELAIPIARRYNDSLIVIEPTVTFGPRWSPFVSGQMRFFAPPRPAYLFADQSRDPWREIVPLP
jgi:hypothetical protein